MASAALSSSSSSPKTASEAAAAAADFLAWAADADARYVSNFEMQLETLSFMHKFYFNIDLTSWAAIWIEFAAPTAMAGGKAEAGGRPRWNWSRRER